MSFNKPERKKKDIKKACTGQAIKLGDYVNHVMLGLFSVFTSLAVVDPLLGIRNNGAEPLVEVTHLFIDSLLHFRSHFMNLYALVDKSLLAVVIILL